MNLYNLKFPHLIMIELKGNFNLRGRRKFDFLRCRSVEDKIRIGHVSLIQHEKGTKFSYYKCLNLTFTSAFIPFTFSFVLVTSTNEGQQQAGDRSWLTDRLCLLFNSPHFYCCENLLSGRTTNFQKLLRIFPRSERFFISKFTYFKRCLYHLHEITFIIYIAFIERLSVNIESDCCSEADIIINK
ncbi:hypothetical protein T10_8977 [Trichinella papuae]|uniref:Uncharacterized protein n=1 Tax=Trichinella papuae TaxID=268474 RepID=A0A0V1MD75_9BILA|nr:hypothetical protein T10_8977 [Trichinella papuae]